MNAVPNPPADPQRLPLVVKADDDPVFRLAQLILMLDVVSDRYPDGIDIERLAVFGFLAAHPLLLAREDDDPDRMRLLMAGFDDRAVGYASAAHRYVTHRIRTPQDLALLVAYGLVAVSVTGRVCYRATSRGRAMAHEFTAVYARSYADAARIVVGRLRRFSDRGLWERMQALLEPRHDHPAAVIRDHTEVDHPTDFDPAAEPDEMRRRSGERASWAAGSGGTTVRGPR
jgi:hypothetical protein